MKFPIRPLCCLALSVFLLLPVSASGGDGTEALLQMTGAGVSDPAPAVSAEAAILTDENGTVLWSRNADRRMAPASTTKIMTALTVLSDGTDTEAFVSVPAEAVGVEGSSVYLYEGEVLTVRQLLDAVLMESANDAAAALAAAAASSAAAFVSRMNALCAEMGLKDTHFVNPHGLDDSAHYTTARELAAIARAAMGYELFSETVRTYKKEIPLKAGEGVRLLINHNKLLKTLDGCIGIKTGYTKKAGRCLVSACERSGVRLYCVTLSAPDDWRDHTALYEWGFSRVASVTLTEAGEQYAVLPVVGGVGSDGMPPENGTVLTVAVRNTDAVRMTLPNGHPEIEKELRLPRFVYAPVEAGAQLGTAVYTMGDTVLCTVPLYACETVAAYRKPTVRKRIADWFAGLFSERNK